MAVQDQLIKKFIEHYGPPNSVNPKSVIDDYTRAFGGTSPDILDEAVLLVMKNHVYPGWPSMGDCNKYINQVAERKASARVMAENPDPYAHIPPPTPEQKAAVKALVADAVAQIKRPTR